MKTALTLLLIALAAGCVGGTAVTGETQLRNIHGGIGEALATDFVHLTTPSVEGGAVRIGVEIGRLEAIPISTNDCVGCYEFTVEPVEGFDLDGVAFALDIPEGWEVVSGATSWSGSLQVGEEYIDTIVLRPTRAGVWEVRSKASVPRVEIGVEGSGDRYNDEQVFYVLYDGTQILLSRDGVWCAEGTYFDAKRLVCTTAPECPEGYLYINGTAECAALARQIEDTGEEPPREQPPGTGREGPGPA